MRNIIKKYKTSFFVVTLLILGCSLWNTIHPYLVKQVLDLDFTQENIVKQMAILVLLYAIVHILRAVFMNMRNIKVNKMVCGILKDVRQKLFGKVLNMPMKIYDEYRSADIYTRLTVDVSNMNSLFAESIPIMVNNVLYIIFMMIMMYTANIPLAVIGTITLILITTKSITFICKIRKIDKKILDKRDMQNKKYSQMHHKSKLTYLFGLQEKNQTELHDLMEKELTHRKRYIFLETFSWPITLALEALGIFFILYCSLNNITPGISVGSIYLIIYYMRQCRSPLDEIYMQLEEMQTCLNSYQKIKTILDIKEEENIQNGKDIGVLQGDIEFKQVSMSYGENEILKNISFTIQKGQKVTIVGRTGVGKTTLTGLLMRLYDIRIRSDTIRWTRYQRVVY